MNRCTAALRVKWHILHLRGWIHKKTTTHNPKLKFTHGLLVCVKCECVRPAEASVRVPAMPRGRPPRWLTESGHLATTCHLNLLRLLWWYLTQRCPCHYCWEKTEVRKCVCVCYRINYMTCKATVCSYIHKAAGKSAPKLSRNKCSRVFCDPTAWLSDLYGDNWIL